MAATIAMLSALLLAPLLVWVMDAIYVTERVRTELFGRTMYDFSGQVRAELLPKKFLLSPWPGGATPIGEFHVVERFENHGWPVTTTRMMRAPQVDIKLIVDAITTKHVAYDPADAETVAIDAIMRDREQALLADAWQRAADVRENQLLGWVFGSVLWCAMLWVAMLVLISLVRLSVYVLSAKRLLRGANLRGQNKCGHCGYDLRGLEFNERCPECGHLSW